MKLNTFPIEQNAFSPPPPSPDVSTQLMPYTVVTVTVLCSLSLIGSLVFLAYKYYGRGGEREQGSKGHTLIHFVSFMSYLTSLKEKLVGMQTNNTQILSTSSSTTADPTTTTTTATLETTSSSDPLGTTSSSEEYTNVNLNSHHDLIVHNKNMIRSIKDSFYTKIKNESMSIVLFYRKFKEGFKWVNLKKLFILPKTIRQTYLYNFLRSQYYVILYFLVTQSNQWGVWLVQKGKHYRYVLLRSRTKEDDRQVTTEMGSEDIYENDITKVFNDTFDHLMDPNGDEEYQEITHKLMFCPPVSTTTSKSTPTAHSSSTSTSTSSTTTAPLVKLPKFHYDYYSKKIIFHPNSLYHEQNAKKYNRMAANIDGDKLYSSVTIQLTTCNRQELTYFPRYPWYWDGVELFCGISVRTRPFYHPDFLSVAWKPRISDVFMMTPSPSLPSPSITKTTNTTTITATTATTTTTTTTTTKTTKTTTAIVPASSSSSTSSTKPLSTHESENESNRVNFTLSLTRTNSF